MDPRANPAPQPQVREESSSLPFLVVGVGASAGGLEALNEFFGQISSSTGAAFIVIQHLSPDFKSMMGQLLSKHTRVKVVDAEDEMPVMPDHVYMLPWRADLRLRAGRIELKERSPASGLSHPIDTLFESLALHQRENSACVVLSGSGGDGLRGLQAVKEVGGLVMVQDPDTAQFDGMPNSALSTGLADFVGSPAALAMELSRLAEHPLARGEDTAEAAREEAALDQLLAIMQSHLRVDFTAYKRSGVFRRVQRRLRARGCNTIGDYVREVEKHPDEEIGLLREAMLIGVTRFLRDAEAWQTVEVDAIGPLVRSVPDRTTIRAWVAGCSTGQEAYTLATLMDRAIRKSSRNLEFRIFATDVDAQAIARASSGEYTADEVEDIPKDQLDDTFDRRGNLLVIRRSLRDRVTFATHNILHDPPFTKLHLLTCRNLLIYLEAAAQAQVMSRFEFALLPRSYLFLGASETVGHYDAVFQQVNQKWKLFQRREGVGESPRAYSSAPPRTGHLSRPSHLPAPRRSSMDPIYEAVIGHYVPPGIAIDEEFNVLHVFGDLGQHLALPSGRVNLNLLKMVADGASSVLSAAIRKARKDHKEVNCRVSLKEGAAPLLLRVIPPEERSPALIFLQDGDPPPPGEVVTVDLDAETATRIQELEEEAMMLRQNLQTAVQEHETANEELQATNEELIASNEELQSTNEELQSVNEELYTVNTEYQEKIGELEQVNEDLEHVLAATQAGILILDNELRIRRYNAGCLGLFPLMDQDVGRPLGDIAVRVRDWKLEPVLETVLETGTPFAQDVSAEDGREWALTGRRLTRKSTILGVIVTMTDLSQLRPQSVRRLDRMLTGLSVAQPGENVPVLVMDVDTGESDSTEAARAILGIAGDQVADSAEVMGFHEGRDRQALGGAFDQLISQGESYTMTRRVSVSTGAGEITVKLFARVSQYNGSRLLIALLTPDTSDSTASSADDSAASSAEEREDL